MAQIPLDENLDIVARSDISVTIDPLTKDLNIIQKLDDEPNDVGGMSAQELKETFDRAGNIIKSYINDSLVPQCLSEGVTEQTRVANENQRKANETARQSAESSRASAESARVTAENARKSAESARVTAENSRKDAESERASAENMRKSAESSRQTAESARNSTESERVRQESERQSAENSRKVAESIRSSAESERVTAENARKSAESARADAESARASAEQARQTAESERQKTFDAAESKRQDDFDSAEQARQETFDAAETARNQWGDYTTVKAYVPGNKVYYQGSSYVNIAACAGIAPTNTAYWQIIARRGRDGDGGGLTQDDADLIYLKRTGGFIDDGSAFDLGVDGQSDCNRSAMSMAGSEMRLSSEAIPPDPSEPSHDSASLSLVSPNGQDGSASLEVQTAAGRNAVVVDTCGVTLQTGENKCAVMGDHIEVTSPQAPDLQVQAVERDGNAAVLLNGDKIVTESEIRTPYDYAVLGGFEGTEEDFLDALGTGPWLPLNGGGMEGFASFQVTKGVTSYVEVTGSKGTQKRFDGDAKIIVSDGAYTDAPGQGVGVAPGEHVIDGETFQYTNPAGFDIRGKVGFFDDVFMSAKHIRNLAAPTMDYDAANKSYVDSAIQTAIDGALAASY